MIFVKNKTTKRKKYLITGSATAAARDTWIERESWRSVLKKFTERGGRHLDSNWFLDRGRKGEWWKKRET